MKLQIPYHDLRSWIDLAGEIGEIRKVDGASWSELLNRRDPTPAALFDKIPGYPEGHRVLVNFFSGRRKNMTLGLPADMNNFELSDAFTEAFQEVKHTGQKAYPDSPCSHRIRSPCASTTNLGDVFPLE